MPGGLIADRTRSRLRLDEVTAGEYDDLGDRVEDAVRAYVLAQMPADPSGELERKPLRELQVIYGNWRGRPPAPRPRAVHRSRELNGSNKARENRTKLAELVRTIEARRGRETSPEYGRGEGLPAIEREGVPSISPA
jgi:hypothetical protein